MQSTLAFVVLVLVVPVVVMMLLLLLLLLVVLCGFPFDFLSGPNWVSSHSKNRHWRAVSKATSTFNTVNPT